EEIIAAYYKRAQRPRSNCIHEDENNVRITKVTVHDDQRPRMEFESGGKLYVTVEAHARSRCEDMSVVIAVVDDLQYKFFDTCTQRLGADAITLEKGQTLTC